ncbi:DEAD/DEAH box helicase [Parasaccharibacter sp. TMW2.1885]|uniref:DEAD/DEAH box helicase n=1 Tax=Parasaccharibacter sp. TMW2.1885 TaxID=2039287 RepID=UPI00200B6034|nr:DEAD/DEAH box helicase [Parasaccharibacter sp. TMW2.1885]
MANMLTMTYGHSKAGTNAQGMRPMQERVYNVRQAQHILLKAPPAAGKSRALMFVALDKMRHQHVEKTIICVPETSIGGSFRSTSLPGFECDWVVEDRWNLCLDSDESSPRKVRAFQDFLQDDKAQVLVCTHATFRFGYDAIAAQDDVACFDSCFIAVDEFHHVSADDNNRLGFILRELLNRDRCHLMAMTGSYFRGDSIPVLRPEDETRFTPITYSYYEQLEGYEFLKTLGISYEFYKGTYINGLKDVLDPTRKTIIHIPHRGSSEAFGDKYDEVGQIIDLIGTVERRDPETGFDIIRRPDGQLIKLADLVDDGPNRDLIKASLARTITGPDGKRDDEADRAKVDIIIALGMAKEGFDWVWCEHALTIGYRSSLTEIVQIIGRATRDAPAKTRAVFTNLVAEPGVETQIVQDAVNDMLKAISGSLLMEQVLAPNFKFYRREDGDIRAPVSTDAQGHVTIGIHNLDEPPTQRARDICERDMNDLVATTHQHMSSRALNPGTAPEVLNQPMLTGIIEKRYPDLTEDETESVRQQLSARINLSTLARQTLQETDTPPAPPHGSGSSSGAGTPPTTETTEEDKTASAPNTLLSLVQRLINVKELDIELIDSVNCFRERFEIISRDMDAPLLAQIKTAFTAQRYPMATEEAIALWPRIKAFRDQEGRMPDSHSPDELEQRLAMALVHLAREKARTLRQQQQG